MVDYNAPSTAGSSEQRRQADMIKAVERLEGKLQELQAKIAPPKNAQTSKAPVSHKDVKAIIRARRVREAILGSELFADPAWDMLLELYAAELAQRRIATYQLCKAAAVPATTALRWIEKLEDLQLVRRQTDPKDRRRILIELTDRGSEAMQQYFSSVRASGQR